MKTIVVSFVGVMLLMTVSVVAADDATKVEASDTTESASVSSCDTAKPDQLVVYYLHSNRRCVTCKKLEAYSEEALSTGFAEQLKDSSIVWRVINFEEEGNKHYAKDYQLYSQSVIISKLHDGKETEWKNLDKIWKLAGDKDEFITYVQTAVNDFMGPAEKE